MVVARIKRIKKIGNYRAFQGWTDEGRPKEFARVNLIYGANGSGKSTLATLLRECSSTDTQTPPASLELEVDLAGSSVIVTESEDTLFWPRLRVFNPEYVYLNLRFDDPSGPNPSSLLTLGKPNLETEDKLRKATARLADIQPQLKPAQNESAAAVKQLESRLSQVARGVYDDLHTSSIATYRGTNTYTKANVRKLLDGAPAVLEDASVDIATDRATALSATMPTPHIEAPESMSGEETVRNVRKLLCTDVVVQVIESLRDHADRATWVQEGIPLHEGLAECLFCGNPLTPHRKDELAAHFDDGLTSLQSDIDAAGQSIRTSVESSRIYRDNIPADGLLYPELAAGLREARARYRSDHDDYVRQAEALLALLESKRSNPFQNPPLAGNFTLVAPSTDAIETVVNEHQNKSETHDREVATAARRVELARVKEFVAEYAERQDDIAEKQRRSAELETEINTLRQEITGLQNVSADPVPSAEELTKNVERLLGRGDLKFTTAEDGAHYLIERGDEPAMHLSEGERTAIALLHFLFSVRQEVTVGDEPIIVVDDPVSSLDESILYGASSYLWAELVGKTFASQLFLLTHNFELFRQWIIQLEAANSHVTDGFTVHEIRTRYRQLGSGSLRRMPQFEPWPIENKKQSRRLRSQYHFLFARVAKTVIEAAPELSLAERMDLLALAPNAARKMMEAFLSFRYPQHIGDFHNGMRAAIAGVQDQSVRTHVERYLHAYSHNESGDISAVLDPSEATVVLRALFVMMKESDEAHFESMCRALMIDQAQLLAVPANT